MTRRLAPLRAGPPTATLLRRVGGARPGTLAVLVEVWGVDEVGQRAAIEARLAAGMAAMFERRDGSLTARLKVALIAGDRWLRQVAARGRVEGADAGEARSGDPARAGNPPAPAGMGEPGSSSPLREGHPPGILGAGASLLFIDGQEAFLAQAGPSVAYRLDLEAPGAQPDQRLVRHPAASPWLRRGLSGLSDDALWPPLGMSQSGALEVHFGHWAFPPGAAVMLAPSRAAELLSRPRVSELLAADEAGQRRLLDELLPPDLPLLCLSHPLPPTLGRGQDDDGGEDDGLGAADRGPVGHAADRDADDREPDPSPRPPERWVRWIGPPAEVAAAGGGAAGSGGEAVGPDEPAFDTGLLSTADLAWAGAGAPGEAAYHGGAGGVAGPAEAWAGGRAEAAVVGGPAGVGVAVAEAAEGRARATGGRTLAVAARILLALLPRRDGVEGEEDPGYARERARWGAALALALPGAALTLTLLMSLRQISAGPAAAPSGGPAAPAAGDPPGVARLADLAPLVDLPGEVGHQRQLVLAGSTLAYVLNRELSQVDWVNLTTKEQGVALARGQAVAQAPVVGQVESIALVPPPVQGPDSAKAAELVALDAADRLWWLRPGFVEALAKPASPPWMAVDHLAGFQGRLYALDRSTGQIYRYEAIGGSFPRFDPQGLPWFGQAPDLSQVADWAIDGDIYLRLVDGSLRRYRGGEAQPFALSGLPVGSPPPVLGAIAATSEGGPILAVDLAGGGILVLGPEGAWRGTLLRPANPLAGNPAGRFQNVAGLAWDSAAGRLYVLEGRSLYSAGLPALP